MLKFDVKRKINTLRDILVGKVPDPKAQVEQITIAMIYKFMDDIDLEGMEFGRLGTRAFFRDDFEKYAWANIMQSENSGQQRAVLYAEGIDKMAMNPHLPQLFRDVFRGAYVPYRDPDTLNMFLKEISEFSYDNSEDLGNAFEYLLSIMGSQGDAGQFRTPRHIIDMIVEIVDPKKNESVLDPACGSAGFLISSYKHILENNKDKNGKSTLTTDDRKHLSINFAGYDISPDMVRLSRVNMYLHKFTKPQISEYDTLTSEEKWNDSYDVILANPPFMTPKGGIIPHNRYRVQAKRAEVLFVDYIAEHLNPTGRAGIIVPEGIVFQSANAYKQLREYLVNDNLLYAVISLPAGVFNPYSGVKTSVLLFDKTLAKNREEILFVKMNNDGYDLGAQRREIKQNDIPDIINIVKAFINGEDVSYSPLVTLAKKEEIKKHDYILVGERYKVVTVVNSVWPMVELGEVCEVFNGSTPSRTEKVYWEKGNIPWFTIDDVRTQGRIITYTNQHITEQAVTETSVKILPANTVLLCCTASVGEFAISKIELTTNQQFNGLVIKTKNLLPEFLFYCASQFKSELFRLSGETAFKFVSIRYVKQIKIPLPPLSIQQEIVTEIESYQKIIDGARQVVDNYRLTIKVDPSWEIIKLGDICENLDSKRIPITSSERNQGEYPYYGASGIVDYVDGYIFDEDLLLLSEDGANLITRVTPIAFSITGKVWVNNHAHVLKFQEKDTQKYIEFYINQMDISNYVTGAAQPKLSQGNLTRISIPLPPLETQQQIVAQITEEMAIVEQNKRLIEIFEQKIEDKMKEVWGE
ncbi:N-6 DNA methylase [Anaerorhabdus furcosa]|uniref:site-specific DNA-methyltransferase (adenine-specific) n=1 Tax=Anaerorhabdus furcosa TaxID=118967 RepID=A0A1T4PXI5_9FIRM|nr:N-6 DNA methylase [Anaerorhabdus furcosa]SJZ96215.1 type I restriction enzyme M protein [Anaerorhabdus furcosa]